MYRYIYIDIFQGSYSKVLQKMLFMFVFNYFFLQSCKLELRYETSLHCFLTKCRVIVTFHLLLHCKNGILGK